MTIPLKPQTVPSPCRRICGLDDEGYCTGCGRSVDDIREWLNMDEQAKRECVARARQRLGQRKPPSPE